MPVQAYFLQRRPQAVPGKRKSITLLAHKRFGVITICLLLITVIGAMLLFRSPITHVMAAGAVPSKIASIAGASGNQQVSLNWGASTNATGYIIELTDLATGQAQQLPQEVATTSSIIGSLIMGHWYRFRVIPVNGAIQGIPSDPVEIRTTGFQGFYDHYYVLGDSYSSGEGAPPYTGVKGCYRSTNSYAYQLGMGIPTPVMLACSGAITDNIDKTMQHPGLPGTQLQQLQTSPQQGNTLITITIGGNDAGFAKELENCIFSFKTCTTRQAAISQRITALEPRLVQVYQEIRQAAPEGDIVALGYPLLLAAPDVAKCHNPLLLTGLSKSELTMIRQLAGQMDAVITQAASQAGIVSAADQVEQSFSGHEVCTKDQNNEWVNEITGLTSMVHGSFHPKTAGYLADALAANMSRTALYQNGLVLHS
jgi:lysophospholipase L1-like esterase